MSRSTLSRWGSEFFGVALFAAALFALVALATHDPLDPVWFFSTDGHETPVNFAGRVGAFVAELSFQVVGFSSYLLPLVLIALGWHYFWCRPVEGAYIRAVGLGLTLACTTSFLTLAFSAFDTAERPFGAGGYVGGWIADLLAEYLNRTGSIILILTFLFLAVLLMTQVSFGHVLSRSVAGVGRSGAALRDAAYAQWINRRRERGRGRRNVVPKRDRAAAPAPEAAAGPPAARPARARTRTRGGRDGGAGAPPRRTTGLRDGGSPRRTREPRAGDPGGAARPAADDAGGTGVRPRRPIAGSGSSRCPRCPCSTRCRRNSSSMSASSSTTPACSRTSARNSRCGGRSSRYTRDRW